MALHQALYFSIVGIGLIFSVISFVWNIESYLKLIISTISGITLLVSGMIMFTTDIALYQLEHVHSINYGWVGSLLVILGVIMILYSTILIVSIMNNSKQIQFGTYYD